MDLAEYVMAHTERGDCECGRCIDAAENPTQPEGRTIDLVFFKMKADQEADAETLRKLIKEHKGVHCETDLLDGQDHNYLEVGAWIGDQGAALLLMGLGTLLGLWKLYTPPMLMRFMSRALAMELAGAGMILIQANTEAGGVRDENQKISEEPRDPVQGAVPSS